jgi:hypothetical protein
LAAVAAPAASAAAVVVVSMAAVAAMAAVATGKSENQLFSGSGSGKFRPAFLLESGAGWYPAAEWNSAFANL